MTVAHFATIVAIDCGPIDGKWFNDIPIVRLSPDQPATSQARARARRARLLAPRRSADGQPAIYNGTLRNKGSHWFCFNGNFR